MKPPDPARVAILNGFGRSLGDSIIGVQALSAALELGALPSHPVLCAPVSGAALLVSTDTAMPHLADAYDLPCLTFFTTHWRLVKCKVIPRSSTTCRAPTRRRSRNG